MSCSSNPKDLSRIKISEKEFSYQHILDTDTDTSVIEQYRLILSASRYVDRARNIMVPHRIILQNQLNNKSISWRKAIYHLHLFFFHWDLD